MKQSEHGDFARQIDSELMQLPQAIRDLTAFYSGSEGRGLLAKIPPGGKVLFAGMGSSYPAAVLAAMQCCQNGVDARAVQVCELTAWPGTLLGQFSLMVVISPDGINNGLVELIVKIDPAHVALLTNTPDGGLAGSAMLVLPLCAGTEKWSDSKTFVNSVALLWLVCRRICQTAGGSEAEQLKQMRQRVQLLLEGKGALIGQWQSCLDGSDRYLLTGSGLQAVVADQAGLRLATWAGIQSTAIPLNSYQQGYAKLVKPGLAVILWQNPHNTGTEEQVMREVGETGARLICVRDGYPQLLAESPRQPAGLDAGLSILLNIVSGQLLAFFLRSEKGTSPGK